MPEWRTPQSTQRGFHSRGSSVLRSPCTAEQHFAKSSGSSPSASSSAASRAHACSLVCASPSSSLQWARSASAAPPRCSRADTCRFASSARRTPSARWHGGGAWTLSPTGSGRLPPSPSPCTLTCCIHRAELSASSMRTHREAPAAPGVDSARPSAPAGHQPMAPRSRPSPSCPRHTSTSSAASSSSPPPPDGGGSLVLVTTRAAHHSPTAASPSTAAPVAAGSGGGSFATCLAHASAASTSKGAPASVHVASARPRAASRSAASAQLGGSSMARSSAISMASRRSALLSLTVHFRANAPLRPGSASAASAGTAASAASSCVSCARHSDASATAARSAASHSRTRASAASHSLCALAVCEARALVIFHFVLGAIHTIHHALS